MRLVMMGTGPFAVPTFRELFETHHAIVALVTSPIKPSRERSVAVTPMRDVAREHGTPIVAFDDVNSPESLAELTKMDADLLVVCDYGQILSTATLATSRLGGINLHASLLPRYRGAAPINWAIYHGETETGVSVIHMTPKIDAGPVIAQGVIPIRPDETAIELESRLSQFGAWFVRRAIDSLETGKLQAVVQNPAQASKAPRLKKTDGLVDWSRPASAIKNQYRAMEPWPKTYTYWIRPGKPSLRLLIGPLDAEEDTAALVPPETVVPGTVLEAAKNRLVVAAGQGCVVIRNVQPAGKRLLSVQEFLCGHHVAAGDRMGGEEESGLAETGRGELK